MQKPYARSKQALQYLIEVKLKVKVEIFFTTARVQIIKCIYIQKKKRYAWILQQMLNFISWHRYMYQFYNSQAYAM